LQIYASVSDVSEVCYSCFYGCCKNRSGCCICCNDCTRMLQTSVSNVSSAFSDVCCKCVYLDVAYISHIFCKCLSRCCICFAMVFNCFLGVCLQVSQTHVSSVASVLRRTLQVLHLDVSKVDECSTCYNMTNLHMLHMLGRCSGSPCGRLRPADVSIARIRRQGEAGATVRFYQLWRYGVWALFCYEDRMGRASVTWGQVGTGHGGCARTGACLNASCGRTYVR
jgi:hypothetical protein